MPQPWPVQPGWRDASRCLFVAAALTTCGSVSASGPTVAPHAKVTFVAEKGKQSHGWFEVTGLTEADRAGLGRLPAEKIASRGLLEVFVRIEAGAAERPLLGATPFDAGRLRFQPRFPLVPGQG